MNGRLMASCFGNICTKNYKNLIIIFVHVTVDILNNVFLVVKALRKYAESVERPPYPRPVGASRMLRGLMLSVKKISRFLANIFKI